MPQHMAERGFQLHWVPPPCDVPCRRYQDGLVPCCSVLACGLCTVHGDALRNCGRVTAVDLTLLASRSCAHAMSARLGPMPACQVGSQLADPQTILSRHGACLSALQEADCAGGQDCEGCLHENSKIIKYNAHF